MRFTRAEYILKLGHLLSCSYPHLFSISSLLSVLKSCPSQVFDHLSSRTINQSLYLVSINAMNMFPFFLMVPVGRRTLHSGVRVKQTMNFFGIQSLNIIWQDTTSNSKSHLLLFLNWAFNFLFYHSSYKSSCFCVIG